MRARLVALLVSLACSACGEDRPEPPPALVSQREAQPTSAAEPAPPETAALGPPSDPAPAPADESAPAPLPAPQPGVAHVFVVPEGAELAIDSDAIVDLDPEGPPDPDGLSPSAERLVAERIERFRAATLRELAPFDLGDGFAATCEANLATRHFVSVVCRASTYGERGETAEYARTKLLAVEGSTVRDLELASLFLPGTDVKAIAREACDRFAEREDRRACNIPDDEWAFGLAEDGVLVLFAQGTMEEVAEFVLPYASVADRLLAAGPLALALDRRGITTRAVPVDPSAAAAIAANGPRRVARWAVAPMGATADLAAAWASLPEEQRARVSRADDYLVAADEASARAVAAILGTTATEVQVSESGGQPLTLARAARDVPLLRAPSRDAEVIATLPRGTLLGLRERQGHGHRKDRGGEREVGRAGRASHEDTVAHGGRRGRSRTIRSRSRALGLEGRGRARTGERERFARGVMEPPLLHRYGGEGPAHRHPHVDRARQPVGLHVDCPVQRAVIREALQDEFPDDVLAHLYGVAPAEAQLRDEGTEDRGVVLIARIERGRLRGRNVRRWEDRRAVDGERTGLGVGRGARVERDDEPVRPTGVGHTRRPRIPRGQHELEQGLRATELGSKLRVRPRRVVANDFEGIGARRSDEQHGDECQSVPDGSHRRVSLHGTFQCRREPRRSDSGDGASAEEVVDGRGVEDALGRRFAPHACQLRSFSSSTASCISSTSACTGSLSSRNTTTASA